MPRNDRDPAALDIEITGLSAIVTSYAALSQSALKLGLQGPPIPEFLSKWIDATMALDRALRARFALDPEAPPHGEPPRENRIGGGASSA